MTLPSIDLTLSPKDPLPRTLGGVEVRFDGMAAEIVQTAPGRVIVVVPQRTLRTRDTRTVAIQVFVNGAASNTVRMPLRDSIPGFLTHDFLNPASDAGIAIAYALNADGTINRLDNPAAAGSTVTLFATGLGAPPRPRLCIMEGPVRRPLARDRRARARVHPGRPAGEDDTPVCAHPRPVLHGGAACHPRLLLDAPRLEWRLDLREVITAPAR